MASATSCRTAWRSSRRSPAMTRAHLLRAAGAAVRRGRRAALVAAAFRSGRAHADLRRPRRGSPTPSRTMSTRPAMPPCSTRWCRSWKASVCRPASMTASSRPTVSDEVGTLFEHCARALDASLAVGDHGLPLIGTGDWNDGMNRVGELGQGESVWLGWLLYATLTDFAPLADARGEAVRAWTWRAHAGALQEAARSRGLGRRLVPPRLVRRRHAAGSATNTECRIDSIAQSWAVISGAADPGAGGARHGGGRTRADPAAGATGAAVHAAIRQDARSIPATSRAIRRASARTAANTPMPPCGRSWHSRPSARATRRRRCSPCSIRSTTRAPGPMSTATRWSPMSSPPTSMPSHPHVGRGGWTWYTGSAGWMQRAGVESILGLRVRGDVLELDPCIPKDWPRFEMTLRHRSARYEIVVENPGRGQPWHCVRPGRRDGDRWAAVAPEAAGRRRHPSCPGQARLMSALAGRLPRRPTFAAASTRVVRAASCPTRSGSTPT